MGRRAAPGHPCAVPPARVAGGGGYTREPKAADDNSPAGARPRLRAWGSGAWPPSCLLCPLSRPGLGAARLPRRPRAHLAAAISTRIVASQARSRTIEAKNLGLARGALS